MEKFVYFLAVIAFVYAQDAPAPKLKCETNQETSTKFYGKHIVTVWSNTENDCAALCFQHKEKEPCKSANYHRVTHFCELMADTKAQPAKKGSKAMYFPTANYLEPIGCTEVAEPTTEATTEATTEPQTEATTEPQTEPTTEATTEPQTEATTEPETEATTEATTEEPQTEATPEPTPEPQPDQPSARFPGGRFPGGRKFA